MLECVIVDDEKGAVDVLSDYIQQTPGLRSKAAFRDAVEALNYIARDGADVLFLDINMPNLSGMQLADLLRNQGVVIVFCTAYSEYAVESYEKNAVDYLLKPIPYERFLNAVEKARRIIEATTERSKSRQTSARFFVKSGSKIHQLNMKDLLYMKKDGHYIEFHTSRGQILSRMNMEELMRTLPRDRCVRVHKSYVVVIDKIETIEKDGVTVAGKEIPVGRSYRDDFMRRIHYSGN
jgi:DNA-binding LytR/AlgR family response regulator